MPYPYVPNCATVRNMSNIYGVVGSVILDGDHERSPAGVGEAWFAGWRLGSSWELVGGRLEPVEVTVSAAERSKRITAEVLRKRLPIAEMLTATRQSIEQTAAAAGQYAALTGDAVLIDEFDQLQSQGPQRGQALTPDELGEVAAVYRRAWLGGEPVTEAVQKAFHLSRSGAAKRIMRARAAGLLDDVGPGR